MTKMTAIARKATMATLAVLLLALFMLPSAVLVYAASVTVSTDKMSYSPGQVLTVSGTVSPVTAGQDVAIIVSGPTGEMRAVDQVTPSADGTYSKDVMTFAPGNPSGTWTVKATYQAASSIATFTYTGVPPQTSIIVDVAVSTGQVFVAGDKVDCYLMSSYNGKALDADWTASVYAPTASPVTLSVSKLSTGLYRGSLTLAANATAGTYTVMATASVNTTQYLGSGVGVASFTVSGTLKGLSTDMGTVKTDVGTVKTGVSDIQKNFPIKVDISPIWIAVVLSLIAAVAAVYSTITVQRKIAG
jgi:hypothetical protein